MKVYDKNRTKLYEGPEQSTETCSDKAKEMGQAIVVEFDDGLCHIYTSEGQQVIALNADFAWRVVARLEK